MEQPDRARAHGRMLQVSCWHIFHCRHHHHSRQLRQVHAGVLFVRAGSSQQRNVSGMPATCGVDIIYDIDTNPGDNIVFISQECPQGTYSNVRGITDGSMCTRCPAGTYSSMTGQYMPAACLSCPAGKFSQAVGAISLDTCDKCGVGTFSDAEGATECTQCVKGTYSGGVGQPSNNTCTPCPAGEFLRVCKLICLKN